MLNALPQAISYHSTAFPKQFKTPYCSLPFVAMVHLHDDTPNSSQADVFSAVGWIRHLLYRCRFIWWRSTLERPLQIGLRLACPNYKRFLSSSKTASELSRRFSVVGGLNYSTASFSSDVLSSKIIVRPQIIQPSDRDRAVASVRAYTCANCRE